MLKDLLLWRALAASDQHTGTVLAYSVTPTCSIDDLDGFQCLVHRHRAQRVRYHPDASRPVLQAPLVAWREHSLRARLGFACLADREAMLARRPFNPMASSICRREIYGAAVFFKYSIGTGPDGADEMLPFAILELLEITVSKQGVCRLLRKALLEVQGPPRPPNPEPPEMEEYQCRRCQKLFVECQCLVSELIQLRPGAGDTDPLPAVPLAPPFADAPAGADTAPYPRVQIYAAYMPYTGPEPASPPPGREPLSPETLF